MAANDLFKANEILGSAAVMLQLQDHAVGTTLGIGTQLSLAQLKRPIQEMNPRKHIG